MNDIAEVGDANDQGELADDLRAVLSDDVGHEAENADRGEADDHHHDLHDDFLTAVDEVGDLCALLTGGEAAGAKEDGDHDDRQHVGGDHRLHKVGREDIYDDLHDGRSFLRLIGQGFDIGGGQRRERALEDVDQRKADHNGQRGGGHIVNKGLETDGADALEVVKGDNAVGNGEQNNGDDKEFQQVYIDGADGLDPFLCELAEMGECEDESGNDAEGHADEYFDRQAELLLFFHDTLLFFSGKHCVS